MHKQGLKSRLFNKLYFSFVKISLNLWQENVEAHLQGKNHAKKFRELNQVKTCLQIKKN